MKRKRIIKVNARKVQESDIALGERIRAAFFFKQWGGVRKKSTGRHYRGRTFDEMPRAVAMA